MPCLFHALKSIVDNLGLNEPLAPSPLPYTTIVAIFSPPSPMEPTYVDQVLDFLAHCARVGQENPLPAALVLAGMLLLILPFYEATPSHEDDIKLIFGKLPLHSKGGRTRKLESTRVSTHSHPTKMLEIEAQIDNISREISCAEDDLESEGHDEWCSHIDLSLPEDGESKKDGVELEARIEKDLMDRMETEGKIDRDLVEKMEQEAQIEKELAHAIESLGAQSTCLLLLASSFTMSLTRQRGPRFGRPTQMGKRVGRRRGQNQGAVPGEKLTSDLDLAQMGGDIPELEDAIPVLEEGPVQGITDIKDISYGTDISVITNVSDITNMWT